MRRAPCAWSVTRPAAFNAARCCDTAGRLIGIEPLPLRVVMAGRRHARFEVREGRAEDLSAFAAGSFDAVYLNGVFPRLEQPSLALSQAL